MQLTELNRLINKQYTEGLGTFERIKIRRLCRKLGYSWVRDSKGLLMIKKNN